MVRGGGYQAVLLVASGDETPANSTTPATPLPPSASSSTSGWSPAARALPFSLLGVACAVRELQPHAVLATAVLATANRSLPEVTELLSISDALLTPTVRMARQLAGTGARVSIDTDSPKVALGLIGGLALERSQRPPMAGAYPAVCESAHGAVGPV
jgi:hypothetical protein